MVDLKLIAEPNNEIIEIIQIWKIQERDLQGKTEQSYDTLFFSSTSKHVSVLQRSFSWQSYFAFA